jgi:L,D-peptidoglycan transpeptidase YkuD (ErfK/YbiS/YcfS/YnhG family)
MLLSPLLGALAAALIAPDSVRVAPPAVPRDSLVAGSIAAPGIGVPGALPAISSPMSVAAAPAAAPATAAPVASTPVASPVWTQARSATAETWRAQLASHAIASADSIVVEKNAHTLTLYAKGQPVRQYLIALGRNPVGDKERLGDGRTPEGLFHVAARNAESKYHRALRISYPDAAHAARAARLGATPGGDIMIHGLPNGQGSVGAAHRDFDWTEGCVALTDEEIDEIFRVVSVGTPIEIKA